MEALERARAEEAKLRELSFRAEESRVREGLDGFIPHKVTQVAKAVKELDAEKARLNELEGKMKEIEEAIVIFSREKVFINKE